MVAHSFCLAELNKICQSSWMHPILALAVNDMLDLSGGDFLMGS